MGRLPKPIPYLESVYLLHYRLNHSKENVFGITSLRLIIDQNTNICMRGVLVWGRVIMSCPLPLLAKEVIVQRIQHQALVPPTQKDPLCYCSLFSPGPESKSTACWHQLTNNVFSAVKLSSFSLWNYTHKQMEAHDSTKDVGKGTNIATLYPERKVSLETEGRK